MGKKYSAVVERRVDIVKDTAINGYVDQVAPRVAHNSDVEIPITVGIIRRNDAGAFTLIGGHLYVTTGLLLKPHSEGELASVLARGIAHTATYAVARLLTRGTLLQLADNPTSVPAIGTDGLTYAPGVYDIGSIFGSLKFRRQFELEAHYFGIQYVYKSGYDTDCFLIAVQSLSQPDPSKPRVNVFDPFPPLANRMKMLQQEKDDILPQAPGAIVSTSEFEEFIGRLREIAPPHTPAESARPKLVRHDSFRE